MALIVETGVGIANADALVSVAFVDDYATRYGKTGWLDLTVEQKEINIRKGTQFIAGKFPFNTVPLYSHQMFAFPAYRFEYRGSYIDGVPIQVRQAVAEAAILCRTIDLTENTVARDYIYKRTNVGGVEKEIHWDKAASGKPKTFETIEMILAPLFAWSGGGGVVSRSMMRA